MQSEEAKRIMDALRAAIQLEVDGKEFYQQSGEKSDNDLVRKLFRTLADEEDTHKKKAQEIYDALKRGQDWPDVEPPSEKGERLNSIFTQATKELGSKVKIAQAELEAIKIARDMENKSYDFYQARYAEAVYPKEQKYYQALAAEERGHYLALVDSYEYLTDPAGWFAGKEHVSLDGG